LKSAAEADKITSAAEADTITRAIERRKAYMLFDIYGRFIVEVARFEPQFISLQHILGGFFKKYV
jgi:hypothetical protein